MPGLDGLEAIRRIMERGLDTRIVVLTSFATDENVFPAIKAGALGYLLKDSEPEDLVRAIRQVHRGEPSLHPEIDRKSTRLNSSHATILCRILSSKTKKARTGPPTLLL